MCQHQIFMQYCQDVVGNTYSFNLQRLSLYGSTLQANGSGNGEHLNDKDVGEDIV